ncbi:MAG: hypothetical protein K2K87_09295, partial [Lachnospiraceae bacterium]|nr:hypothetical protein [Lachnospiraceae bacterium]
FSFIAQPESADIRKSIDIITANTRPIDDILSLFHRPLFITDSFFSFRVYSELLSLYHKSSIHDQHSPLAE